MKVKQENYSKGKHGETLALEFLQKNNYILVEQNWSNKYGEIDLIVSKDRFLVFVEVKYKTDDRFGIAQDMITPKKLWQVKNTAQAYLLEHPKEAKRFPQYRIDAVCINGKDLKHYENVA